MPSSLGNVASDQGVGVPRLNTQGDNLGTPRPTKRRRVAIACTPCRYRKSRCDGCRPKCSTCENHGYDCTYPQSSQLNGTTVTSRGHLESVELRLSTVERLISGLASRVDCIEQDDYSQSGDPEIASERQVPDCVVDDDEQPTCTDSQDPTDGIGSIVFTEEEDTGYFGPSSNIAFTRFIVRATNAVRKRSQALPTPTSPAVATVQNHMLHASRPPSPGSQPRGRSKKTTNFQSMFTIPPADETLALIEHYFSNTGLLFPYIHRETFFDTYRALTLTSCQKVRRSWLGLLNMVLAMSMNTSLATHLTAQQRSVKSEVFFARAMALCERQIRSGSSLEIVQFLLLMSQYLQGTERSIQTWNVHGLAVKAAYQLGLHSKDALSQYPPLEREIRTRTWYGCVILDRSLSMTLGRPSSIPESYIKLDMPRILVHSATGDDSLTFFNTTVTLGKITWTVLESLYGGNLGCEMNQDIFDIASHLLRIEQQLLEWQQCLTPSMLLIQPAELSQSSQTVPGISRFRVILTLRYLNLRVLAHRPILHKFLESLGESHPQPVHTSTLRQVGASSLRACIQSAAAIIDLVSHLVRSGSSDKHLGAWWFSLYYTFNASLVLYSALLIRHDSEARGVPFPDAEIQIQRNQLQQAIESLLLIDRGNRMMEKCAKYASTLTHILDSLYYANSAPNAQGGDSQDVTQLPGASGLEAAQLLNFSDQSLTPLGIMDVSEFMDPADLDFLNIPVHTHSHTLDQGWAPSA